MIFFSVVYSEAMCTSVVHLLATHRRIEIYCISVFLIVQLSLWKNPIYSWWGVNLSGIFKILNIKLDTNQDSVLAVPFQHAHLIFHLKEISLEIQDKWRVKSSTDKVSQCWDLTMCLLQSLFLVQQLTTYRDD